MTGFQTTVRTLTEELSAAANAALRPATRPQLPSMLRRARRTAAAMMDAPEADVLCAACLHAPGGPPRNMAYALTKMRRTAIELQESIRDGIPDIFRLRLMARRVHWLDELLARSA